MWRSLLLGKLAISVVISLLIGGYGIWYAQSQDLPAGEHSSWLGVGIFFLLLGAIQIVMAALMFRRKKFD